MRAGNARRPLNPWSVAMFKALRASSRRRRPSRRRTQVARPADRPPDRALRPHARRRGRDPVPLWIVLFLSAGIIFVFMLFFADSGERALVQATMMGGVTVVISAMLLLLWFLDNPYHARCRRPAADGDGADARDPRPAGEDRRAHVRRQLRCARDCQLTAQALRRSGSRSSSTLVRIAQITKALALR